MKFLSICLAFNPSSPGQVSQTYVAAPPQIAPPGHAPTIPRPVQSPIKGKISEIFRFFDFFLAPPNGMPPQVQQAPPPARPHQEIQSRTTGPFVTHPPKPTRVLHSEVTYSNADIGKKTSGS